MTWQPSVTFFWLQGSFWSSEEGSYVWDPVALCTQITQPIWPFMLGLHESHARQLFRNKGTALIGSWDSFQVASSQHAITRTINSYWCSLVDNLMQCICSAGENAASGSTVWTQYNLTQHKCSLLLIESSNCNNSTGTCAWCLTPPIAKKCFAIDLAPLQSCKVAQHIYQ